MNRIMTVLAIGALAGSALARAAVVSQPPDIGVGGFYADGAPGQFYGQYVADNFSLASATPVTSVTFWGESEYFDFPDYTNMVAFSLTIYADGGGVPGLPLFTTTVPTAATNPTDVGVNFTGGPVYQQEISFPTLNLGAGNYYLSVGGVLADPFGDAWVWNSALPNFDDSISASFDAGATWQTFSGQGLGDLAFEINSNVPAPGAAGLLGAAGLAGLRRRR